MINGGFRLCVFRSLILFLSPKNLFNLFLFFLYLLFFLFIYFFFTVTASPSEQVDEQCLKKESTESKGFDRNSGLNRGEEHPRKRPESVNINSTASSHRATAKSEELKSVHSITETDGWITWTVLSHPRRWTPCLTERNFTAVLFSPNATQLPSRHTTSELVLQPSPCHLTSILVIHPPCATLPQYLSSRCTSQYLVLFAPSPFILQGLGLYWEKVPFWKQS